MKSGKLKRFGLGLKRTGIAVGTAAAAVFGSSAMVDVLMQSAEPPEALYPPPPDVSDPQAVESWALVVVVGMIARLFWGMIRPRDKDKAAESRWFTAQQQAEIDARVREALRRHNQLEKK